MKHSLATMEFGKFLFLYLLGRNLEYFVYKQVLERTLEEEESSPRAKLSQQMSTSDIRDAGNEELGVTLPSYMANAPPLESKKELDEEDEECSLGDGFYNQDTIPMKGMMKQ